MPLDLLHPCRVRTGRQRRNIGRDQIEQLAPLRRGERRALQPFIGNDAVVLMGAAQMQIVREMPAARRQIPADHRMGDDGLALLRRRQRAHEREPGTLLVLEQADACERSAIRISRLRAQEGRRQHHLPAEHEAAQGEVMAEQLPAPGLVRRGRAEQTERVAPFAEHGGAADEIAEKTVQPHHVARGFVAFGAQARAQHVHDRFAHGIRHFIEAQPVVFDVELGVLPVGATGRSRRESSSPRAAPATHDPSRAVTAAIIAGVGASLGCSENRSGMTWPSVVMPVNGAFASSAQPPNSSWARGLCSRASVCARGVDPAIRDCPGAGTNGR